MSTFAYRGRTGRGELVDGRLEADSAEAVATRLISVGITPIDIKTAAARGSVAASLRLGGAGPKPKTADLVLFARQMYSITKSGLPLLRGLRGLTQSTHNAQLREALHDVLASLESGRDLTSSLARHPHIFSPLFLGIVRVGESTGTFDKSFHRLCEYLGQDQDVQDRVRGAVRYPLVVIATLLVALGVITVFVIPNFAPLFRILGDDLPMPTRIVIGASDFIRNHGVLVVAALGAAIYGARRYVSTEQGRYKWDRAKLRIPVVGELLHQAILSRVTRSLAISLDAGLPMIQALTLLARSAGNEYLSERLLRLRDAIERGESLSRAAGATGIFPPLVLQMIAVGEETGDLTGLLDEVAGFYQREVDYRLKNLSALIEPLLIVGVGAMVLILALGVFLPMWDMAAKVGHLK